MAVREGTYKSLLQGVSQQTPQERADGQLGSQLNMLSDPVTSLRRRGGVLLHKYLRGGISKDSYIRMNELLGDTYITVIDTKVGKISIFTFDGQLRSELTNPYFKASSKAAIRSTVARDNFFIVNTELVPTKTTTTNTGKNPNFFGYFSITSSAFSKVFDVTLTHPSIGTKTYTVTASANNADEATPEYIATQFETKIIADIGTLVTIERAGTVVGIEIKSKTGSNQLVVDSNTAITYVVKSGAARVINRSELLGTLPPILDGFIMGVGNVGNSSYYEFDYTTKTWTETGKYEANYRINNEPRYWYIDSTGTIKHATLDIQMRKAGDFTNNPLPKFVGYGITGIGSYQSRLVLLSGSYVNLSKTTDFNVFTRTTVTELLDDDPIEISSASLSSAQFEYAVPYNKDLVLVSQTQQAVIPANNTVLTPKTAVIYPSTKVDISLACEPQVVSRTMYYTYQRGSEYYQVAEFIPNSYTDSQYYNQNLTDHIPLYATGVCTNMATSTTNNMVVFTSDSKEVLVNQFLWVGDERPLMSFHKWEYPLPVIYAQFIQDTLVVFMDAGEYGLIMGTQNVQLNQLGGKPIPFVDLYQYVDIVDGVGNLTPDSIKTIESFGDNVAASIYSHRNMRHKEVQFKITDGVVECPFDGRIYVGVRYKSEFTLTPPFIKDENGKVVAGTRSTVTSLGMEFKNTGTFNVQVNDTMGEAYSTDEGTAQTWSETDLGYTWVNSIGTVKIPCRTRLTSTNCSVYTTGTTDMNLTSCTYILRLNQKHRRI